MRKEGIYLAEKKDCTACSACSTICGKSAIRFDKDKWGFLYPTIDYDLCVGCTLCMQVCPILNESTFNNPLSAFAAYQLNLSERNSCSSGGIATLISKEFIKNGGIVYGAVEINSIDIYHKRIDKLEDLILLKGSKYVHSPIKETYAQTKRDLNNGLKVLFIGTPCQIDGLLSFLKRKEYPNLLTIDLCCHGVSSSQYLQDNLSLISKKIKINDLGKTKIFFRKKILNNKSKSKDIRYGFYLYSLNGEELYSARHPKDLYISGYLSGLFFRENCFSCNYAKPQRVSDITLSDFWGLNTLEGKPAAGSEGVNCILINTIKGKEYINDLKGLYLEERSIEEAIGGNKQYNKPFVKPKDYHLFKKDYLRLGYEKSSKKHLSKYIKYYRYRNLVSPFFDAIKRLPYIVKIYNLLRRRR